jgi:hypothetical protein
MNRRGRLERLERLLVCPVHAEPPWCLDCEPMAPLPEPLQQATEALLDAVCERTSLDTRRAAVHHTPRSTAMDTCPQCGRPRRCGACEVRYGQELLRSIGLTPDEDRMAFEIQLELISRRADKKWDV